MIESVLIILSCIYVQKYDYMNNNYFYVLNWGNLKIMILNVGKTHAIKFQ